MAQDQFDKEEKFRQLIMWKVEVVAGGAPVVVYETADELKARAELDTWVGLAKEPFPGDEWQTTEVSDSETIAVNTAQITAVRVWRVGTSADIESAHADVFGGPGGADTGASA